MSFLIVCPPALVGSSKPSIWKEMWGIRGAGEGGKEIREGGWVVTTIYMYKRIRNSVNRGKINSCFPRSR